VGFWRGVGYFISILFVIGGLIMIPFTYGVSLVSTILGFVFIWMLRRSASQERMEKTLEEIRNNSETVEQRKMRKYEEDPNHCVNCGKYRLWDTTNPLCKQCQKLERESEIADKEKEERSPMEIADRDKDKELGMGVGDG
jgi:hypothetical protein